MTDDALNWSPHVQLLSLKLSKALFILRRLKVSTEWNLFISLYFIVTVLLGKCNRSNNFFVNRKKANNGCCWSFFFDLRQSLLLGSRVHEYSTRFVNLVRTMRFRLNVSERNSLNIGMYNHLSASVRPLYYNEFKKNSLWAESFIRLENIFSHYYDKNS